MTYTLASAAYEGSFTYYAVSGDNEIGFETKREAMEFIAQANDTPEWQAYCAANVLKYAEVFSHDDVVKACHCVLNNEDSSPIDEMRAVRILKELGE